jgi:hypothetical protein
MADGKKISPETKRFFRELSKALFLARKAGYTPETAFIQIYDVMLDSTTDAFLNHPDTVLTDEYGNFYKGWSIYSHGRDAAHAIPYKNGWPFPFSVEDIKKKE